MEEHPIRQTEEKSVPTLEYTRSVCTCGRELSSLYYYMTAKEQFDAFAEKHGLTGVKIPFTTIEEKEKDLLFCCLLSLRFGIKAPIASAIDTSSNTTKYPSSLPGPMSKEKILTWF